MKSKGANDNGSRRIMSLTEVMGSGLKILVSAVNPVPAHHCFQQVVDSEILPRLSLCPDLCPTQAHSSAFQRTNAFESRGARMAEPARRSQWLLAETWGVGRDLSADLSSRLLLLLRASRGDPTALLWHGLLE